VTETILTLRTSAIWGNNRKLTIALFVFLAACIAPAIYAGESFLESTVLGPSPDPSTLTGCITVGANKLLWIPYMSITVFESVIFALTLYRAKRQIALKWTSSSLLSTIYRDGILFYAYLFVTSLVNIIVFNVAKGQTSTAFISFHRVLHAIFTSRLIMNMRNAATENSDLLLTNFASVGLTDEGLHLPVSLADG